MIHVPQPPQNPYRGGKIFEHRYIHDDAIVLVKAVRSLMELATETQQVSSPRGPSLRAYLS
jgi:hypothetical protein